MKRILKITLFIFILYLVFQSNVFAAGSISPSPRSLTITEGSSSSFTITASNAVGRVNISSSNSGVASVSNSSLWVENNSSTVTVTGKSAGTATITVSLYDAATFDEEALTNSYSISVTVNDKQQVVTNPTDNEQKPINTKPNTQNNNLSKNNEIGTLSVEGYELADVGNKTYELTVNNNVTKINIIGTAKDSKAKITGTGSKELKPGENVFTITIVAESGAKNTYTVKIIRKENLSISDLSEAMPNITDENVEVVLDEENSSISEDIVNIIKENKKTILLNKYNENGQIIYSWTLDGSKIKNTTTFNTTIKLDTNEETLDKITSLTNYTDGMYMNFEHSGILPEGTKTKIYVGNKFKNGRLINLYFYNEESNKLENIENGLEVKDCYIEFEIEHCSTYFATEANLGQKSIASNAASKIIAAIAIIEFIIIIGLGYMCYKKK